MNVKKKINLKFPYSFIAAIFKLLEPYLIFRKIISISYRKIRPNYSNLMEGYMKGQIQSNDEREGKDSILKRDNL